VRARQDKALLVDWVGGAPRLVMEALERREPAPGEVRYRVHAIGLNRADLAYMQGGHYTATVYPSRICYEAAGVVDAVGEGVAGFKVGDRVSAIPFGDHAYCVGAESAITPADYLAEWPAGYSAAEAAATWMQYCTAYFPLKELTPVGRGDTVLVSAASSSAGLGAIQMAKLLGATVVASTRTSDKRDFLIGAGADHIVTMSAGGLAEQILACTGGAGVRVVYDAVGGRFMHEYADAVSSDAQIFIYGAVAGDSTIHAPILPLIRKGAVIRLYSLINLARDVAAIQRARLFISLALRAGALRPIVDRVFPFEQAAEGFEYMMSGAQRGKIVLLTTLGAEAA
jgi:NADPH:quinone reductase-like Zn-dependent oxidoreductase